MALLKEFYGRGPTRTKSYYEDDLVTCLLRGGFSRVEHTLLEGGRGASIQCRGAAAGVSPLSWVSGSRGASCAPILLDYASAVFFASVKGAL